jgi:two-component system phosphate regulon sensor histidine kinase PhoR
MGGTGLGLAIVKHLTQAMHGSVRAASRPGQGTTFTVCLPLAEPG